MEDIFRGRKEGCEETGKMPQVWQMPEPGSAEEDWLWLCAIPQLGWQERMTLLRYFGSAKAVRHAQKDQFRDWKKVGVKWIANVTACLERDHIGQTRSYLQEHQICFVSKEHPMYPRRLQAIVDPPHGLFYRGRLPQEERLCAAVVGARACSGYGQTMTRKICTELAKEGVQIISGMAMGIDGIAQRAALEEGTGSFAVLGSGADVCYPMQNEDLYLHLVREGGIVSEYACKDKPMKHHFPMRNRIISGMSDAVILIEARAKSGSLITTDYALDQGREIYVLPGRSGDELSYGCNRLISQGASIILSPGELVQAMKEYWPDRFRRVPERRKEGETAGIREKVGLAPEDELVYSCLDSSPKGLETITAITGLSPAAVSAGLVRLQMEDLAAETARNQYIRQQ